MFKDKSIQLEEEFSYRVYAIPKNKRSIPQEYDIKKVDNSIMGQKLYF